MKLFFAIVIIFAVSILGSRLTFLNRRLSMGFRNILFTGFEYIFIGAFLGGMGLKMLDADALKMLKPLLVIGLCWIGFLFGVQFDLRQLKLQIRNYFYISAVQALVTFAMVAAVIFILLSYFTDYSFLVRLMLSITLGSSASCSAQSALAIVSKNYMFQNRRLLDLLRFISAIDGFFALLLFGAAMSIFPGAEIAGFDIVNSLKWLVATIGIGVIPALILISLSRVRFSEQEFFVFIIGTIILCGGLAHQIHYSPLISGMICGLMTANFCRHSVRALSVVMQAEKSLYIILLLMLGASWNYQFKADFALLATAVYFFIRVAGKISGAFLGTKLFKQDYEVPASLGLGLISDGGLAVAIIIDAILLYPQFSNPLVTVIIISVFFNELLSPWLILGRFKREERYRLDGKPSTIIDVRKFRKEKE